MHALQGKTVSFQARGRKVIVIAIAEIFIIAIILKTKLIAIVTMKIATIITTSGARPSGFGSQASGFRALGLRVLELKARAFSKCHYMFYCRRG